MDRSLNGVIYGRVCEHGTGIRWCMPVWTKCIEVLYQVTRNGPATSCEDSTNLVYAHGASAPSIYKSIARSTVPLRGGLHVVCERGLWALERWWWAGGPRCSAAGNSTFGCGFEFKQQEMTILAMRTALFVGQCPVLLEGDLRA